MRDLNPIVQHERHEQRLTNLGLVALLVVTAVIFVAWFVYL